MEFHVIIPVRYASTRLAAKALVDIAGKPMIQHVYERGVESGASSVTIATDDDRIADAASTFGAPVCMTSPDHQSGTERISEAVGALGFEEKEIIVCLQGDEPLLPSEVIRQVAEDLHEHDNVKVTSVCSLITRVEDLLNPNMTKAVMNHRNYAIYFSRAPIPWERETFSDSKQIKLNGNHYRHIGIYAYRAGFLQEYVEWGPSPIEEMECLEQLRILWHGGRIHLSITKKNMPPSVDTAEDLEKVRALFKEKK